jgi:hypothetical protein
MAEFRGFWRYPPITFLRILYPEKNMVGGYPRNLLIDLYSPLCIGITEIKYFKHQKTPCTICMNVSKT